MAEIMIIRSLIFLNSNFSILFFPNNSTLVPKWSWLWLLQASFLACTPNIKRKQRNSKKTKKLKLNKTNQKKKHCGAPWWLCKHWTPLSSWQMELDWNAKTGFNEDISTMVFIRFYMGWSFFPPHDPLPAQTHLLPVFLPLPLKFNSSGSLLRTTGMLSVRVVANPPTDYMATHIKCTW